MRDYINIISNLLTESRGISARRPGEEFVSNTNSNNVIYFDSVVFYPEDGGQYSSYEEMSSDLEKIVNAIPNADVDLIGNFKKSDLAFGVAIFKHPSGRNLAFVKPFSQLNSDPTQNKWDNQTGIPGYRYNSKAAAKTQAGLTPQDILTNQENLSISDIVKQIEIKFGNASPLVRVANDVASAKPFPISIDAPAGISFTAFRDYFCELLHPIALQVGLYTGNAGDAAMRFLGQNAFDKTLINFGKDKTEGLSDSVLVSGSGNKIKVSSKGSKGADASAKNLLDTVDDLSKTDKKLAKKHQEIIGMLRSMIQAGQAGAPLLLGEKFNIIDKTDADIISNLRGTRPGPLEVFIKSLPPTLKELALGRTTKDVKNVNIYFHLVAAVAHKVADHINKETNFSQAASEILNNGALIQVYTKASESGGKWIINDFKAVWPGTIVSGVEFKASKTYYSTDIKGNFTFKILNNGEKSSDEVEQLQTTISPSKTIDTDASLPADAVSRPSRKTRDAPSKSPRQKR
jgi:hypothetical protein